MDTSSSVNDTMSGTMYLHFTGGDNLFFKSLHPSSNGAIAGACLCLVALALLERFVNGTRNRLDGYWRKRASALTVVHASDKDDDCSDKTCGGVEVKEIAVKPRQRISPPFIPSHDIPRGIIYMFQAALAYALMLAVMTFNAAYAISIILGLGIGEGLFGRIGVRGLESTKLT